MRLALAAALFLSASVALAEDRVFVAPTGSTLRLHDAPCVSTTGALATMPPDVRGQFKAATVVVEGQKFDACWADVGGATFIVDELGGQGAVEGSPFKPARDA